MEKILLGVGVAVLVFGLWAWYNCANLGIIKVCS